MTRLFSYQVITNLGVYECKANAYVFLRSIFIHPCSQIFILETRPVFFFSQTNLHCLDNLDLMWRA